MARWLFLILLVLNLLLFLWGYRQPGPSPRSLPPLPEGVPQLRLMSEVKSAGPSSGSQKPESSSPAATTTPMPAGQTPQPATAAPPPENTTADDSTEQPTLCVRLGPLRLQGDATQLARQLTDGGIEAKVESDTTKTHSGFWVLIPPGTQAPDALVSKLKRAGIGDVWRFSKGGLRGSVSLGLYSDRRLAEKRVDDLKDKGFAGEVRPRTIQESTYWVATRRHPDDPQSQKVLDGIFSLHPDLTFPPPACQGVATPQANP